MTAVGFSSLSHPSRGARLRRAGSHSEEHRLLLSELESILKTHTKEHTHTHRSVLQPPPHSGDVKVQFQANSLKKHKFTMKVLWACSALKGLRDTLWNQCDILSSHRESPKPFPTVCVRAQRSARVGRGLLRKLGGKSFLFVICCVFRVLELYRYFSSLVLLFP